MRPHGGISGIGQPKPKIRRDWTLARRKLALEDGRCRKCGSTFRVECAHVVGREHDKHPPIHADFWKPYLVAPDRIIPLCHDCHQGPDGQHAKRLDLLPLLALPEQLQAVADAGQISVAYNLLMPSESPKRVTSGVGWPE